MRYWAGKKKASKRAPEFIANDVDLTKGAIKSKDRGRDIVAAVDNHRRVITVWKEKIWNRAQRRSWGA